MERLAASGTQAVRRLSVSGGLRVIAAALLVLVVVAVAQQSLRQRRDLLAASEREMARLVTVYATQADRSFATADIVLLELADSARLATDATEIAALERRLRRRVETGGLFSSLAVLDTNNRVIANGGEDPGRALPAMTGDGTAMVLLAGPPGDRTLWFARVWRFADGTPGGHVVARISADRFDSLFRAAELGEGGAVGLWRRDGALLAGIAPPAGDADRVSAHRDIRGLPLAVEASMPVDVLLAPWRANALLLTAFGLAAGGVVGALLLLLATESRRAETLLRQADAAREDAEQANRRLVAQMEERERTEAALRQAQRLEAVGQLTGGVAHDFNNLLTVILGNVDLLQARLPGERRTPDPTAIERLERIRQAAEKGATLTDQLLAFARRQPLIARQASLNTVISDMTDLIRSALGSSIRLEVALDSDLWPVLVDTTQIELVFLNLVLNARDAMPRGGQVTMTSRNLTLAQPEGDLPAGDYVLFDVHDSGIGMSEATKAKAFEPFFTTKGPGRGSGLGLSQVYGVAKQLGGSVRLDSTVDVGTSVRLYLPRSRADATAAPAPGREVGGSISVGARVLLVDDDAEVRTTTSLVLAAIGYIIHEAECAATALDLLTAGLEVDLLLTDVAMPGMNGGELADIVRARWSGLPIIFISGYADPDAIAGHQNLQPLVRKPFRATELAAEIERALAECRRAA